MTFSLHGTDEKKLYLLLSSAQTMKQANVSIVREITASGNAAIVITTNQPYLILKKLYDLARNELNRYLNAEMRRFIGLVENLWDKYALSFHQLESNRAKTLKTQEGFLQGLGYLEAEIG